MENFNERKLKIFKTLLNGRNWDYLSPTSQNELLQNVDRLYERYTTTKQVSENVPTTGPQLLNEHVYVAPPHSPSGWPGNDQ